MCICIKEALEQLGRKCWMDIDGMHGNIAEAIVNAI